MAEEPIDNLRLRLSPLRRVAPWIVLFLAKLWLVDGQALTVYGSLTIDDQWFVARASSISAGQWMGTFDAHTLIKQPGYPLFIAAVHALRIPLLLAHQLLYAGAVALMLVALRPVLKTRLRLLGAFVVLLFNPMTMNTPISARVDRSGVYPALTLALLACLVGLVESSDRLRRSTVLWAIGCSASFAALWLVREEWLLVVPAVVIGLVLAIVRQLRSAMPSAHKLAAVTAIAVTPLSVLVGTLWLREVNEARYGLAVTNIEQTSVSTGLGPMFRVAPATTFDQFPVTRETRALIYAVSPHFEELRTEIEAATAGRYSSIRPDGVRDLGGQVFQWVLLDAVGASGQATSGPELDATFRSIAVEIDTACSDGRLRCTAAHSGIAPAWRWNRLPALIGRSVTALRKTCDLGAFSALSPPGDGSAADRALFAGMTGESLAPTPSTFWTRQRVHLIGALRWLYRLLAVIMVGFAVARAAAAFRARRRPSWITVTVASVGLLVMAVRAIGLAYLDLTAFPAFSPSYLASGYAAGLAVGVTVLFKVRDGSATYPDFVTG
jgi:hypothetical protein